MLILKKVCTNSSFRTCIFPVVLFVTMKLHLFDSDNCNTSIVNFHRSCPNPDCSYDLCLSCCWEIRKGSQPGGNEAESPHHQFVERIHGQGTQMDDQITANGKRFGWENQVPHLENKCVAESLFDFSDWRAEADGRILALLRHWGVVVLRFLY